MTVDQLRKALKKYRGDTKVVLTDGYRVTEWNPRLQIRTVVPGTGEITQGNWTKNEVVIGIQPRRRDDKAPL